MAFSGAAAAGVTIFPLRPLCGFAGCAAAFASAAAFFSSSLLAFLDLDFKREKSAMVSVKHEWLLRKEIGQVKLCHNEQVPL
jgi:hypothetical protein